MTADRFLLPRVAVAILSLTLLCPAGLHAQPAATGAPHVPTIDELVELGSVGAATLSPDGRWVAYEESGADWERDAFVTQLFVADTSTGTVTQLTRGKESAGDIEWSPDSRWITFLRNVDGKGQIHAIRPDGGEALVLSKHDESVANHEWTPDGTTIVFAAPEGEDAAAKARKDSLGDFTVVRKDYRYAQLWTLTCRRGAAGAGQGTAAYARHRAPRRGIRGRSRRATGRVPRLTDARPGGRRLGRCLPARSRHRRGQSAGHTARPGHQSPLVPGWLPHRLPVGHGRTALLPRQRPRRRRARRRRCAACR